MVNSLIVFMLLPVACVLLLIIIHISLVRKGVNYLKSFINSFLISLLILIAFLLILGNFDLNLPYSIISITIFLCLSGAYLAFTTLGETSLRIKIMSELLESSDGLSLNSLKELYNNEKLLETRLNRMIESDWVSIVDNKFYLKNKFWFYISKLLVILKYLVIGKKSQFD